MRYRADIDGLRALAVLPVLFYHVVFQRTDGLILAGSSGVAAMLALITEAGDACD